MSLWQHAFNWAFEHGTYDAFGYAEWYCDNFPDGDVSHPMAYSEYTEALETEWARSNGGAN